MARRDAARMGYADCDGCGGEAARGRDVGRVGFIALNREIKKPEISLRLFWRQAGLELEHASQRVNVAVVVACNASVDNGCGVTIPAEADADGRSDVIYTTQAVSGC